MSVKSGPSHHNARTREHSPNLSIYENYLSGYGLRVNVSIPKFALGQNLELLDTTVLFDSIQRLSIYVTEKSGIQFDAGLASVARIDFATNLIVSSEHADAFLLRCRRLRIPRMPKDNDLTRDRSVYHGNESRILRVYDKTHQMAISNAIETTFRLEYSFRNEAATKMFADRLGESDHRATTMLSAKTCHSAVEEMLSLLRVDSFEPDADYSLGYFLSRTEGNLDKARRCSSFVAAYDTLGPDFCDEAGIKMSPARYLRELRECQSFGF